MASSAPPTSLQLPMQDSEQKTSPEAAAGTVPAAGAACSPAKG